MNPDPSFNFTANPDSYFQFNADPNPIFHLNADPDFVPHQSPLSLYRRRLFFPKDSVFINVSDRN